MGTVQKRTHALQQFCLLSDHPVGAAKQNVPSVVSTAKADTKQIKRYKPKVLARQRNNYGYGTALGYAEESRYSPRGVFFR